MSDVQLLPEELLPHILSRLPVKSLLRSRCVSKPWRDLIDSQYFIKLHLSRSIDDNANINIVFGGDCTLHYLDFDSPAKTVEKIDHPLYREPYDTVVLGSCNGIVCLSTTKSENEVALWNPSTRRFKNIPLSPVRFKPNSSRRFCIEGFGYDKLNDDYKVVRLVQYCGTDSVLGYSMIEVYSQKSNMWRKIGDFPYYICYQMNYSVFVNGALHWLVSQKKVPDIDYLIVAFDLTTEKYQLVQQPQFSDKGFEVNLAVLGGCLCMVCSYHDKKIDIWVMRSYGVKSSWMKLFSTTDIKGIELGSLRPIMLSKSGREVLIEEDFEMLFWYDLEKKIVRRFMVDGLPEFFASYVFLGSLVQVDGDSASCSGAREEMKEKKNDKRQDDFLSEGFKLVL